MSIRIIFSISTSIKKVTNLPSKDKDVQVVIPLSAGGRRTK
jgi:hypothetical protein